MPITINAAGEFNVVMGESVFAGAAAIDAFGKTDIAEMLEAFLAIGVAGPNDECAGAGAASASA